MPNEETDSAADADDDGEAVPVLWTRAQKRWAFTWGRGMKLNQREHEKSAYWYRRCYQCLKLPIAVLTGYTLFGASFEALGGDKESELSNGILWSIVVSTCILAVLQGVVGYVEPAERAKDHAQAAAEYSNLSRKMDLQLLSTSEESDFDTFMQSFNEEFRHLIERAPPLDVKFRGEIDLPSYAQIQQMLEQSVVVQMDTEPSVSPISERDRELNEVLRRQMERLAEAH